MQNLKIIDTLIVCDSCGYPKNNHRFRHLFNPAKPANICELDGKTVFQIDATIGKTIKIKGKCSVPQCNRDSNMHWDGINEETKSLSVIKHTFQPSETTEYRSISFTVPEDTKCVICGEGFENHSDHKFKILLNVLNKKDSDVFNITGKRGKINFEIIN